ncbi:putative aspartate transaminase AspC3 [Nitritalea halalkaliphila LW7]|uniref:Aminotransferase n=1 Tax=Nitritalea halalkaliphila LW7 TaxID=1189621 RepID=I5C3H8_9BACT|nr:aminotransferase class I/II-fold pyridoxal phosphate-dependent enzyme [Nitritalea halalkaliphila]EIM76380.1 putative aspartate transaminase AspC3 [Nitritalea halalkaliphila LW7]
MSSAFADRHAAIQPYYFQRKLQEVRQLEAAGHRVIHLGIGSPDLPPAPEVVEALCAAAQQPDVHGYQSYSGLPALRAAMAHYYGEQYGVQLDPEREILPLMGSKEGIMHLSMAFLNPGDAVMVPDPGYPSYAAAARMLGAAVIPYTLSEAEGWEPTVEALEAAWTAQVKILYTNFPHMPTGAVGSAATRQMLVDFARQKNIVLVHDNPYSQVLVERPASFLSLPGATSCVLELNSLSKSANLAGWRIGMLCGRADWIAAVLRMKSNMDSGMFYGLQQGAIAALQQPRSWYESLNTLYAERREALWAFCTQMGWRFERNRAGMFVWAGLPEGQEGSEVVDRLLQEKHIFLTPGEVFGPSGKTYVRLSLCAPLEAILEALHRIGPNSMK